MEQICAVYILTILSGVISSVVLTVIRKKGHREKEDMTFVKSVFFFFFCSYFLISALKWFLGSPDNTLSESFWDADYRTYIHYGVPVLIFSVLMPIASEVVLRLKLTKLIGVFDSIMFIGLFMAYISRGVISNAVFCTTFAISLIITVIITYLYKKEIIYLEKSDCRKYIWDLAPAVVTLLFMTGVYYPNELYLNNLDEFLNPFGQSILILLFGSVLLGAAMFFCLLLMPKAWIKVCNLALSGMAVMGYLQAMFLNGELQALTGDEQTWSIGTRLVNALIWLMVVSLICVVGYRKEIVLKISKGICIYICLIQIVTLGYMVVTTDVSTNGSEKALTTQNSLELATDDNVLVFVLDMFDSSVFQEILEEDSEFLAPLSDFTFYRNATSAFGHTKISLPYLLTGTQWKEGLNAEQYHDYAYANSDALRTISQQGCDIGVYTKVDYLDSSVYDVISNYSDSAVRNCNIVSTYSTMFRTSMYKLMPFIFKQGFTYYTRDIVEMVDAGEIWTIENDLPFYNNLIKQGLSVNDQYQKAFRFYHMVGDHEPYYLSEDLQYDRTGRENSAYSQAKGCLKIVYEYLNQLKTLGKYEDATIIITADHGQIATYDSEVEGPAITSLPIMLVKEKGSSQDSLYVSDVPVSQTEIMPLVMKSVGNPDWADYGKTFDEINSKEERPRYYVDMLDNKYMIQFVINGDANELANWSTYKMIWE